MCLLNILITGGTGFVGSNLTKSLHKKSHHTYILTRSPEEYTNTNNATYINYEYPVELLPTIHGVINLAGESLFGYWTKKKKASILDSRIKATTSVVGFIKKLDKKPDVFISGSAVGYYGTSDDLMFTEATTAPGDDFLASVVHKWEQCAKQIEDIGIRTVYTRFGVILGKKGALPYMSLSVKLFAGGKIGDGEQWVSWVHIEDVINMIEFCLYNKHMEGPVNVTAPNPQRNKDFTQTLAKVLKRPYWFPAPSSLIRTAAGEMSLLITEGQYVIPQKIQNAGYQFSYPFLKEAFRAINHE